LSVIIRSVSAQRVGSKWRCCDTKEAFNKEHAAAVRAKKGGQAVVLATKAEAAAGVPGIARGAKLMQLSKFQTSICRVDKARTVSR
jgi:hypothetical protein